MTSNIFAGVPYSSPAAEAAEEITPPAPIEANPFAECRAARWEQTLSIRKPTTRRTHHARD